MTFEKETLIIPRIDRNKILIFALIMLFTSVGVLVPLSSYGTKPSSSVSASNFQKVIIIEPSLASSNSQGNSLAAAKGSEPTLLASASSASSKTMDLPPGSFVSINTEGSVAVITASSSELLSSQEYFSTNGEYYSTFQSYYSTNPSYVTAAIPGLWLDSNRKRRTRSQIYVEILELLRRGPLTPFEIAFYARLNHKRAKEYTEFLKLCDYIQGVDDEDKIIYALTREGLAFLDRAKALFQLESTSEESATNEHQEFSSQ